MRINEWFTDKWTKINESIWTRLFILTSIIQTILVMALETRVLLRNDTMRMKVKELQSTAGYESCNIQYGADRMFRIEQENAVFMLFQLYQLWFCFNSVIAQNTIQLIAAMIMNAICAGYSIVQIMEIGIWYADLNKSCSKTFERESNPSRYDIPLIIVLISTAIIMGFLAFKLYQQFGWIIYRKIGGSLKIQTIYRKQLVFEILLKMDLFILILFGIESWLTFTLDYKIEKFEHLYYVPREIYYFHIAVTFSIVFLELIAYYSLKKEWRYGMLIFIFLWVIVIVDLILLLRFSIRTARESWYFLISIIILSVIVSIVTWIYSILVVKDFGSGLKEILTRFKIKTSGLQNDRSKELRQLSLD